MIENIVIEFLDEHMDVPCYMDMPNPRPQKFLLLEKTSGDEANYIQNATVAIQSYGRSNYEVAVLNEQLKKVLRDIVELDEVCSATRISDHNFPDLKEKIPRYQAIYNFTFY